MLIQCHTLMSWSTGWESSIHLYHDLSHGYWQIPVRAASQEKTAFVTPQGLVQFQVMPFGLHGAPGTVQWLMDWVIMQWTRCFRSSLPGRSCYKQFHIWLSWEQSWTIFALPEWLQSLPNASLECPDVCTRDMLLEVAMSVQIHQRSNHFRHLQTRSKWEDFLD